MEHAITGNQLLNILLLILCVEAITEIIIASSIFQRLRDKVGRRSAFLGELINCGYCMSVWISASLAWISPLVLSSYWIINYLITTFIIHRSSNIIHELLSKWFNRRPIQIALYKTENIITTLHDERGQDE